MFDPGDLPTNAQNWAPCSWCSFWITFSPECHFFNRPAVSICTVQYLRVSAIHFIICHCNQNEPEYMSDQTGNFNFIFRILKYIFLGIAIFNMIIIEKRQGSVWGSNPEPASSLKPWIQLSAQEKVFDNSMDQVEIKKSWHKRINQ